MSSSESEDNENMDKILQAVDTNLLNNSLFTEKTEKNKVQQEPKSKQLKSQRYLEDDVPTEWIQYQICKETMDFFYKKLSETISEHVDFSNDNDPPTKRKKWTSRVRLLSDFTENVLAYEDVVEVHNGPTKKPVIKKRQIELERMTEEDKLKSVAVSSESLLQNVNTNWQKNKGEIYKYRTGKDGTCHFLEPVNEFTVLRKKNTWSEKRISRDFKKK